MPEMIRYPLESGGSVLVEIDQQHDDSERVGLREGIKEAKETFEQLLESLKPIVAATVKRIPSFEPLDVSLELGCKISAEHGIVIAKATAEANIKLSLTWRSPTKTTAPTGLSVFDR
jgi:hypothetical protein